MKKLQLLLVILGLLNFGFAQEIAKVKTIRIQSKALHQTREILISTPQSYDESSHTYYDVIYVFDAQNREFFDYTHSIISFLSNGDKKFIVVGITSPYNEKLDYSRKTDFLPILTTENSKNRYGKYAGNADNFLGYVKNEVIPFVESNYRTLSTKTAVGHSLGASFLIYSMLHQPYLFNNYISLSPNLEFDDQRLVNNLKTFDYSRLKPNSFLFFSNADESNYWKEWGPAFQNAYGFLKDSVANKNVTIVVKDLGHLSHWNSFAPGLSFALEQYFLSAYDKQQNMLSEETYEIIIRTKVPDKADEIYIVGNQTALGNWQPNSVKMTKISEYYREIKLQMRSPAEFKFTKGTWESEAIVQDVYSKIILNLNGKKTFNFKIEGFSNE